MESVSAQRRLLEGYSTIHQTADELGRTIQTIYNLMNRGLPFVQIGGTRLIPIAEAREWLASQRVDRTPRQRGRPRKAPVAFAQPGHDARGTHDGPDPDAPASATPMSGNATIRRTR